MKFSLQNAHYYSELYNSGVDFLSLPHAELLKRMGLQLGAVESVENWAATYAGIPVVRIVSCEKHPDADKLHVCLIDDGLTIKDVARDSNGYVQVVCGAPNVRAGMYAAWLPPGATVPSSHASDPFKLQSRDIRGVVSNGMLASAQELALSDDHDGILEITADSIGRDPHAGEMFAPLYGLDDFVVDCENKMFTHRPDCFGNMGIAREVAAIFGYRFRSPDWYHEPLVIEPQSTLPFAVANEIPELVTRFCASLVEDITVAQSPLWLAAYLTRVGIRPINAIVDVSNYFMHVTAQPTHTFDYDKFVALSDGDPVLFPRMARSGETLELLNGKTITLTADDMVIATTKQAVALAGIMGGTATQVDSTTKRVVIECATFDMFTIRRSSMRHGLFTDAVTRYSKGQSPLQNDRILAKLVADICEQQPQAKAGTIQDIASFDRSANNLNSVTVTAQFINSRLGTDLTVEAMSELLERVECTVAVEGDTMSVIVPFWRMDIAIAEDLVEEIGRLHGFNAITAQLPIRPAKPSPLHSAREYKQSIRRMLSGSGANELLTYTFVDEKLFKAFELDPQQWAYHLRNALSPELQYYRVNGIGSLLAKVHGNIKAYAGSDQNVFALYEIGKAHISGELDEDGLPQQHQRLAFCLAGDGKFAANQGQPAYYQAKAYLDMLSGGEATYEPLTENDFPITAPYQIGRSATVKLGSEVIGVLGEFKSSVRRALKLPEYCAGFELDIRLLQNLVAAKRYTPLSNFPAVTQDVTFEVSRRTTWGDMTTLLRAELDVLAAEGFHYDIQTRDIYAADQDAKVRVTYRINLTSTAKTMKTEEVSELLDKVAGVLHERLQAIRI